MDALTEQMQEFQRRLGERVKARRKAAKLGQKELASAVGYESHTMISEIENGRSLPSMQKVIALAYTLGCTVEELIGGRAPVGVPATESGSISLPDPGIFDEPSNAMRCLPSFARKECADLFRKMAQEIDALSCLEVL